MIKYIIWSVIVVGQFVEVVFINAIRWIDLHNVNEFLWFIRRRIGREHVGSLRLTLTWLAYHLLD
jgi:hypothetical protein